MKKKDLIEKLQSDLIDTNIKLQLIKKETTYYGWNITNGGLFKHWDFTLIE